MANQIGKSSPHGAEEQAALNTADQLLRRLGDHAVHPLPLDDDRQQRE
jgi:hypothetical protein